MTGDQRIEHALRVDSRKFVAFADLDVSWGNIRFGQLQLINDDLQR